MLRPFNLNTKIILQDRLTDIMANRSAKLNQKGCPTIHLINGKLYAKLKILTKILEGDMP